MCACVCACVCVSVSVCESVREEGTFSSQPPAAFAFTRETSQPDLFFFLFFFASCWKEKGKRTAVIFFFFFFYHLVFSTVDVIFTHTYMCGGTHDRRRERAGEWVVGWLTIRMYLSGRLL